MPTISPIQILRESTRAVPAVKWALGVAGVVAVIGIVAALRIDLRIAVFGAVIIVFLMVLLVVFARLSTLKAHTVFTAPIAFLLWSSMILTVGSALLLSSSVFFRWPMNLQHLVAQSRESQPRFVFDGSRADYSFGDLREQSLRNFDLEGKTFSNTILARADLTEATLSFARFNSANLSAANLTGVQAINADFRNASLLFATLVEANLIGSDMSGADLFEAKLYGAILKEVNFANANLQSARLDGADVTGALLHKAKGLTQEQINSVRYDPAFHRPPTLPEGLVLPQPK